MKDTCLILATILLLAALGLVRFIGCDRVFGVQGASYGPAVQFRQVSQLDFATSDPASITTQPFLLDTQQGNLIVVWIWYNSNAGSVASVQDSAGNTNYQVAVPRVVGTGPDLSNDAQEIWYAIVQTPGTEVTVMANFQGTPFTTKKAIFAHEYSGFSTSTPFTGTFNVGSGTAPNNLDTQVASGPVSISVDLLFGAGILRMVGLADTSAGFTPRVMTADGNISEDIIPPPNVPLGATFICHGGGDWLVQAARFKVS